MNYNHLTIDERCCIREYYNKGYSFRYIAVLIGRNTFNPYKLFATIAYSFSKHSCSLRKIEESINYDLRFIYLMEQEHPSEINFKNYYLNANLVKAKNLEESIENAKDEIVHKFIS